jgi:hypothetical protein
VLQWYIKPHPQVLIFNKQNYFCSFRRL